MLFLNSFDDYLKAYSASIENPEKFWSEIAETFTFEKKWSTVLKWDFKTAKVEWFKAAKLNITKNCLDRHLDKQANQTALIFEPNNPADKTRKLTYQELADYVNQAANAMRSLGIKKGDRVCLYMSMLPELMVSVLACARIGAVHSVVFAGFSAQSLSERINDSQCVLLITNDGVFRGTKEIRLKEICDEALQNSPCIKHMLVYNHLNLATKMETGRDIWWHDLVDKQDKEAIAEIMDAEDPLFILYTSGSTGKPKGVLHTTAGYMVYTAFTFKNVFQYKEGDIYFCTADLGWITGHSYICYGPLLNGATSIMFEGIPTYPDAGRFWQIVEKHQVSHFYTAPTAIRTLETFDVKFVNDANLSSLKVLGTVGEPINEEAWLWYYKNVGKENCPIVDTWWQTETGGIMISPLAGITKLKPTFASLPLPGVQAILVDAEGNEVIGNNVEGNLCLKFPWPGMARSVYGDHERFVKTYFSTYKNLYFTGDGARRDEDGFYRITGRVDDVLNVSGHRIGTAEIENIINLHIDIAESAVVGIPHVIKGEGIFAYVICYHENSLKEDLLRDIQLLLLKHIGPLAKIEDIMIVPALPKTRSGKIMRRILRKIAAKDFNNFGDTSTLLDPTLVDLLIKKINL